MLIEASEYMKKMCGKARSQQWARQKVKIKL